MFEQIHFHHTQKNLKDKNRNKIGLWKEKQLPQRGGQRCRRNGWPREVGCADHVKVGLPIDHLGIEINPETQSPSSLAYIC